ncbi:metallophosphoesterase family protein [Sphingomonas baiyangensis]|uniref:Serine/threonine protein phosphatase n=1 Tax=Sphingomonas baiyangensis TaxID=2572576 RepID=A0A4V5PTQ8_9SPHN|nr:metallophosphoesterase family protein [Sphingomonas baiyangensis]TKD51048.1 serine/threonine protein phosphatase [Sphingomonas baiyangensis]
MFDFLRKARKTVAPRVPDGERIYAIGDIHGRADLLDRLVAAIERDSAARGPARVRTIFLGDLVDRGPDSAGVVDRVMRRCAADPDSEWIAGNHEEVFALAMTGDREAMRFFVRIGGRETIQSYGVSDAEFDRFDLTELIERAEQVVPPEHVAFLATHRDMIEAGDYVFVHAGIRPGVPLDKQRREDLRWIRKDFLDHRGNLGKIVIHGHTVTDMVDEQPNRIGIDTGAYASGRLTAIALEGEERWYLDTGEA